MACGSVLRDNTSTPLRANLVIKLHAHLDRVGGPLIAAFDEIAFFDTHLEIRGSF